MMKLPLPNPRFKARKSQWPEVDVAMASEIAKRRKRRKKKDEEEKD